jgi:Glycosyl transferase family 2
MITVVIPVHNGGEHLRQCVASLARQDAVPGAFEVVLLDNASSDGAPDCLGLLPTGIPRRMLRSEQHLPIEVNWRRIVELPGVGELITILGHDDLFDPPFIRLASEALRSAQDVRLLLTHFRLIDPRGELIRPCRPMAGHESAAQFLAGRLARTRDSFGTGYVTRFADYRAAGGIPPYEKLIFADDVIWLKLAEQAGIRILPDFCFSYRLRPSSASHTQSGDEMLAAVRRYLSFLEELAARDERVRQVLDAYGPDYVRGMTDAWMYGEAVRASAAVEPARPDLLDAWRAIYRRVLAMAHQTDTPLVPSVDLAFALWANGSPIRRRLWRRREARAVMRLLFRAAKSRSDAGRVSTDELS